MCTSAREPGSASLIVTHALESAVCDENGFLEFGLLLLGDGTAVAPLTGLPCFVLPSFSFYN